MFGDVTGAAASLRKSNYEGGGTIMACRGSRERDLDPGVQLFGGEHLDSPITYGAWSPSSERTMAGQVRR